MCTVTLVALENGFVLTSSRDEVPSRKTLAPDFYEEQGARVLYPRDAQAGGTWLGVSSRKRCICLLNGGFEVHKRKPPYKISRGIVVRDLLTSPDFQEVVEGYDLEGVEPFTLIAVNWQDARNFTELVWDGVDKHLRELAERSYIWSSSPLYTSDMRLRRKDWFREFQEKQVPDPDNLFQFHLTAGIGDRHIDVVMDRGFVRTQSISQVVCSEEILHFQYRDLHTGEVTRHEFPEASGINSGQKER